MRKVYTWAALAFFTSTLFQEAGVYMEKARMHPDIIVQLLREPSRLNDDSSEFLAIEEYDCSCKSMLHLLFSHDYSSSGCRGISRDGRAS